MGEGGHYIEISDGNGVKASAHRFVHTFLSDSISLNVLERADTRDCRLCYDLQHSELEFVRHQHCSFIEGNIVVIATNHFPPASLLYMIRRKAYGTRVCTVTTPVFITYKVSYVHFIPSYGRWCRECSSEYSSEHTALPYLVIL